MVVHKVVLTQKKSNEEHSEDEGEGSNKYGHSHAKIMAIVFGASNDSGSWSIKVKLRRWKEELKSKVRRFFFWRKRVTAALSFHYRRRKGSLFYKIRYIFITRGKDVSSRRLSCRGDSGKSAIRTLLGEHSSWTWVWKKKRIDVQKKKNGQKQVNKL